MFCSFYCFKCCHGRSIQPNGYIAGCHRLDVIGYWASYHLLLSYQRRLFTYLRSPHSLLLGSHSTLFLTSI